MPALLSIDDLRIKYGAREVLKGISLHVDEGEIVTVLGANGAGKSTLLQAVCGLIPVAGGTITYAGRTLNRVPAYEIVILGISLSPEGRRVFPTHSVEENLNLGAFTRRKHTEEIALAKERVHSLFPILKERSSQLAGTLSGGEQQMLAIGRALMSNPRVLLLDEPSLGLAPILVKQIFDIIREINESGTSIILVEQNALMALSIADRGYVLDTGRVALEGRSDDLLLNPLVINAYLGGETTE